MSIPSFEPAHQAQEWRGPSWRVRLVALVLVAAGVGVLGLVGGLAKAPQPPPVAIPTANVNEVVDGGPWKVKVTNAAATTDLGKYKPKTEGNWLLAVAIEVEIPGPASGDIAQMRQIASLPEQKGLVDKEPVAVALIRDGSRVDFINPGLPERVAYIFEVDAGTPVPTQVVVGLLGWTLYKTWTTRRHEWWFPAVHALVTVPVNNQVGAA